MIKVPDKKGAKVIGFQLGGKLHDDDYKVLVPEVEALIRRGGKVRLLPRLVDFEG